MNTSRIAVLAGLVLLVVALAVALPEFHWMAPLRGFGHALPWILFGMFWIFFWSCCGGGCRRRCSRRRRHEEHEPSEA